jgi:tetratricopeptide (TPR) repeat protein
MTEPVRTPNASDRSLSDAEREARIEELLLSGLDHYFSGRYEQAINIWTRVAFLERRHGRARAYIERARSALAERQRESEELLHGGVAAYNAGDLAAARDLLSRAVEQGDPSDTALVFLQRLTRLEAAAAALDAEPIVHSPGSPRVAAAAQPRRTRWTLTIAVSAAIASVILLLTRPVASWLAELPMNTTVGEAPSPEPLPVVRSVDAVLARARSLQARGKTREALRLVERIDPADPLRPQADRLRGELQRALLATITVDPQHTGGTR